MYNVKSILEKEIENVSALTEPYRPTQSRGDLQVCLAGGEKEQTVPKVVVKLAVATVTPPRR